VKTLSGRDIIKLLVSLFVPLAAGGIGSIFTMPNIATWYKGLTKPALTPPDWVFGPVWTTLFILMGIALFLVWRRDGAISGVRMAIVVFGVQLALNIIWSVIFFGGRAPLFGLLVILLLWLAIAATIWQFSKVSKTASLLLVPYICWVSFATYLNAGVWRLN
jgi:benzodiazapine receptor